MLQNVCQKWCLDWVVPDMFSPDMYRCTPTGRGKQMKYRWSLSPGVRRGKCPVYQYFKEGTGNYMKNMLSLLDPPGSVTLFRWSTLIVISLLLHSSDLGSLFRRIQERWSVWPHRCLRVSVSEDNPWKWLTIVRSSLTSSFHSVLSLKRQPLFPNQKKNENSRTHE